VAISARTTVNINTAPRRHIRDKVSIPIRRKSVPTAVRWSFFLFVFAIPFEALDLPFMTGFLSLTKIAGLLLAASYFFYFNSVLKNTSFPGVPAAMWWFLGYFLIAALTGFVTAESHLSQFSIGSLTRLQLVVLFWIISDLLRDTEISTITGIIFVGASIILSLAMLFNLFGIPVESVQETMTGFGNFNTLGGVMAVAFVAAIGLLLKRMFRTVTPNILLALCLLPLLKVIVATGSRSAIATAVIGCLVYVFSFARTRRKFTAIAMLVIGLSASLYLAAHDLVLVEKWEKAYYDHELSGRTEIYPLAIEMFLERPVLGWGEDHSRELGRRTGHFIRDEHNLLLFLLLEVGLVGTLPFLVGIWLIVRRAWRARNGNSGYLPMALLVAVGANNMIENGLDHTSKLFWIVLALALTATPTAVKQKIIRLNAIRNQKRSQ